MADEISKTVIAIANLVANGLVEQTDTGIRITDKGWNVAAKKWEAFSDEDKLLLGAFMKKWRISG